MVDRLRHASLRTRLALGTLVPLGLTTVAFGTVWLPAVTGSAHAGRFALLSAALLMAAVGVAMVMLQMNTRAVLRPLEDAHRMTKALGRGQYGVRVRVERLDEAGRLLVALEQLGDYLAVVLPEEDAAATAKTVVRSTQPSTSTSTSGDSLERIAERLRGGGEAQDSGLGPHAAADLPQAHTAARTTARLRLVNTQP
ncbi:HAMP domain-containing protein [Sphaerotilus sp.]|jgi:methyl-accepting chemotaxis protein|uniref:HAMP domain-containing protein n=1 Tax=Sphaerotilus sp. TaxID=2093942 RepID=UPI0025FED34B|nr:HAMP domain-containing protein [Sphaerotilus sp.]